MHKDGKQSRRVKKLRARKAFDGFMNSHYSGTAALSAQALEFVSKSLAFNVRRLAHWVKTHGKKLMSECIAWLNHRYGTLGGLRMRRHFIT